MTTVETGLHHLTPSVGVRQIVLSATGPTHAQRFNAAFVNQIAMELRECLAPFANGAAELNVYSAPWQDSDRPHGQLTIILRAEKQRIEIGLPFGFPDEQPGIPYRRYFDREAFETESSNPHACGIALASFDECWSLCCHVIRDLGCRSVQLSFGA